MAQQIARLAPFRTFLGHDVEGVSERYSSQTASAASSRLGANDAH